MKQKWNTLSDDLIYEKFPELRPKEKIDFEALKWKSLSEAGRNELPVLRDFQKNTDVLDKIKSRTSFHLDRR